MHLLSMGPDQTVLCCICGGGLISAAVCHLVGDSVSERSQGSRLVETAALPMGSPSSSASSSLSPIQPLGSLASGFCPLVGFKYLYLSQQAACWASQRTAMLGSCL